MKPVLFDSEAEQEFKDGIAWYERQRVGLGAEFQEQVELAVQQIAGMPQRLPLLGNEGLRKCRVTRFPYSIFYLELDDHIWIAAVAHQRRDPNYWSSRQP